MLLKRAAPRALYWEAGGAIYNQKSYAYFQHQLTIPISVNHTHTIDITYQFYFIHSLMLLCGRAPPDPIIISILLSSTVE